MERGLITRIFKELRKKDYYNQSHAGVQVPDTVILENGVPSAWYFTSKKTGLILRKNRDNVTMAKIYNSFMKKSKTSESSLVATFLSEELAESGEKVIAVRHLTEEEFYAFIFDDNLDSSGLLQRFIDANGEFNSVIRILYSPRIAFFERRVCVHRYKSRRIPPFLRAVTFEGAETQAQNVPVNGEVLKMRLVQACRGICGHLERVSFHQDKDGENPDMSHCNMIELYFKIDRFDRLVLLWCSQLGMSSDGDASGDSQAARGGEESATRQCLVVPTGWETKIPALSDQLADIYDDMPEAPAFNQVHVDGTAARPLEMGPAQQLNATYDATRYMPRRAVTADPGLENENLRATLASAWGQTASLARVASAQSGAAAYSRGGESSLDARIRDSRERELQSRERGERFPARSATHASVFPAPFERPGGCSGGSTGAVYARPPLSSTAGTTGSGDGPGGGRVGGGAMDLFDSSTEARAVSAMANTRPVDMLRSEGEEEEESTAADGEADGAGPGRREATRRPVTQGATSLGPAASLPLGDEPLPPPRTEGKEEEGPGASAEAMRAALPPALSAPPPHSRGESAAGDAAGYWWEDEDLPSPGRVRMRTGEMLDRLSQAELRFLRLSALHGDACPLCFCRLNPGNSFTVTYQMLLHFHNHSMQLARVYEEQEGGQSQREQGYGEADEGEEEAMSAGLDGESTARKTESDENVIKTELETAEGEEDGRDYEDTGSGGGEGGQAGEYSEEGQTMTASVGDGMTASDVGTAGEAVYQSEGGDSDLYQETPEPPLPRDQMRMSTTNFAMLCYRKGVTDKFVPQHKRHPLTSTQPMKMQAPKRPGSTMPAELASAETGMFPAESVNDIPMAFRLLQPSMSVERFRTLLGDPQFLYQTMRVCGDCFSEIARLVLSRAAHIRGDRAVAELRRDILRYKGVEQADAERNMEEEDDAYMRDAALHARGKRPEDLVIFDHPRGLGQFPPVAQSPHSSRSRSGRGRKGGRRKKVLRPRKVADRVVLSQSKRVERSRRMLDEFLSPRGGRPTEDDRTASSPAAGGSTVSGDSARSPHTRVAGPEAGGSSAGGARGMAADIDMDLLSPYMEPSLPRRKGSHGRRRGMDHVLIPSPRTQIIVKELSHSDAAERRRMNVMDQQLRKAYGTGLRVRRPKAAQPKGRRSRAGARRGRSKAERSAPGLEDNDLPPYTDEDDDPGSVGPFAGYTEDEEERGLVGDLEKMASANKDSDSRKVS